MMKNDFLEVSVRMMKIQRTNLTSFEHDINEVLRIANYPNDVYNEMWFKPLMHSWAHPFSSQSFPSDNTAGV